MDRVDRQEPETRACDAGAAPSSVPSFYTDSAQLNVTLFTFSLAFHARRFDGSVEPLCEVTMSPQHAKVLSLLLARHVEAYEASVGPVVIPKGAVKGLHDSDSGGGKS